MEDERIIDLYWARDQIAIRKTEEKYGNYLGGIAWRILADRQDCEECLNDTWLRAWNAMPDARPPILSAFLGAITRNLSLDCYRRKHAARRGGGQVEYIFDELTDCTGGREPFEQLQEQELVEALNDFLQKLPVEKRVMFVRRYWYLDPIGEIAGRCGVSEGSVKTALLRLRKKLKAHLRREGFVV